MVNFYSSFRFTAKLRGRYRDFLYIPPRPMHILPHYQHPAPESTFVTTDEPALTCTDIITQSPYFTLGLTLGVVHSLGLEKCIMIYLTL